MGEPIKIVVTAETAAAAVKLQDFVQQSGGEMKSVLKEISKHAGEASGSLGNARLGMMELGHVGRSMADGLMAGISPLKMLAMESPRVIQAVGELGISLATLTPYFVAAGAAAAVLGLEWYAVLGGVSDGTKEIEDLVKALDKVPQILEKIALLKNAGVLTPAAAQEFGDYLGKNPKKQLYRRRDGTITEDKTETVTTEAHYSRPRANQDFGTLIPASQDVVPNAPLSPEEANKHVLEDLLPKVSEEEAKAKTQLTEQIRKAHEERLTQIAQEKAAISDKYQKEIDAIALVKNKSGEFVGKNLSADESQAIADLEYGRQEKLKAIDDKEAKRQHEEQVRSMAEFERAEKQDVTERLKALEDELTAKQNAEGVLRGQLSGVEYQERTRLATSFYFSGEISEAEYTHMIAEAAKKRTSAEKEYRGELEKIAQLKAEIARSETEGKLRTIEGNPLLTSSQKNQQAVPLYRSLQSQNASAIGSLQSQYQSTPDKAAQLQIQQRINELLLQQADLQNKINAAQGENSFSYQIQKAVTHMRDTHTAAVQVGEALGRIHDRLQNELESSMTGLLTGTLSWHQALSQIYNGVLQQIAQELVKLFVEQVVMQTILNTITGGGSGILGGIGKIFGFADGGRPPLGRYSIVGERGPELFVPDTAGTILPADQTAALMSGGGGGSKVSVYSFTDMRAVQDHIERNDDHEKYIMDVVGKNLHRVRQ